MAGDDFEMTRSAGNALSSPMSLRGQRTIQLMGCLQRSLAPAIWLGLLFVEDASGGDKNSYQELAKIVHQSIQEGIPQPLEPNAYTESVVRWSKSVNGLQARVEYADRAGYAGFTVLVGIKNVGSQNLRVPSGNPEDSRPARTYELHTRQGSGAWKRPAWYLGENLDGPGSKVPPSGYLYDSVATGNSINRPEIELKPGQTMLAYLAGSPELANSNELKVVVRLPGYQPSGTGSSTLETPPFPLRESESNIRKRSHSLEMPDHFPQFSRLAFMGGNMFGTESMLERLSISNSALLFCVRFYRADQLRTEFEHRMNDEKDVHMKLLFAREAAYFGSEKAALFVLKCMSETDYEVVRSTHSALHDLLLRGERAVPRWIVAFTEAVLTDERSVTGQGIMQIASSSKIADLADEAGNLTSALGSAKCKDALPLLIELARRKKGDEHAMALGYMGDERAIPVLMELIETTKADSKPDIMEAAVIALAGLKARQAVPVFLRHLEHRKVIEGLDHIGDPSAIEPLKQLVEAKGRIVRDGTRIKPDGEEERLIAARIAVAALDPKFRTERLCELLIDKSFGEFDRRYVVWRLADEPDPKAIPFLVRAVQTDPSGAVVNQSITALGQFQQPEAVTGLIDCLDAKFEGKRDWKRASSPEGFRENIAEALREITGQNFGPDKVQWMTWWQATGQKLEPKLPTR